MVFGHPFPISELTTFKRFSWYAENWRPISVRQFNFAGSEYSSTDTVCPLPHHTQIFQVSNDGLVPVDRAFPPLASSAVTRPDSHTSSGFMPKSPPAPAAQPMLSDPAVAAWAVAVMRSSAAGDGDNSTLPATQPLPSPPPSPLTTVNLSGGVLGLRTFDLRLPGAGSWCCLNFPVDPGAGQVNFSFRFSPETANVQANLISPSGARIPVPAESSPGVLSYTLNNPELGWWRYDYQTDAAVQLQAGATTGQTDLTLVASTDKVDYGANDTIVIRAHLSSHGVSLPGASIQAGIYDADREFVASPTMSDLGNGDYIIGWNSYPNGGYYQIRIAAYGLIHCTWSQVFGGPGVWLCEDRIDPHGNFSFLREAGIPMISQKPSSARVDAAFPITESSVDSDGDGLSDSLQIQIGISNPRVAGDYLVRGVLTDGAQSNSLSSSVTVHLASSAATQPVSIPFDGTELRKWGVDGPYTLTSVRITDLTRFALESDSRSLQHPTLLYRFYDFDGPPLFLKAARDLVEALQAGGHPDTLVVNLDVVADPTRAGTYALAAELQDLTGAPLMTIEEPNLTLATGVNTIRLEFPASSFHPGEDGQRYRLGNLVLSNLGDPSVALTTPNAYTTAMYQACTFQAGGCGQGTGGGGHPGDPLPGKEE